MSSNDWPLVAASAVPSSASANSRSRTPQRLLSIATLIPILILTRYQANQDYQSLDASVAGKADTTSARMSMPALGGSTIKSASAAQKFDHIFIIELENSAYSKVLQNPYFANLASRGLLLSNFSAVDHPSQPNYIAQIAGAPFVNDDGSHDLAGANLVDLMESASVSWKTYQQDYPGNCDAASSAAGGLYARKHNPFISFDSVRLNPARCAKIVNATQLDSDLAAHALPQYSFYVPNQKNDGHDTGISFSANWLQGFLEPKLQNADFMNGTLVVITYDEDDGGAQNHIFTLLLGNSIAPGTDGAAYDHYSMLKFVEDNFNLGTLGRKDATAATINLTPGQPAPTATPANTPVPVTPIPQPIGNNKRIYLPRLSQYIDVQPSFPVRATFYYPWFPEAWTQSKISPYTNYAPTLGYYDLTKPNVILNHLDAMQYAHIQVGIASWWQIGQHTDTHLAQILATTSANNSPFRWSIYYEKESIGNPSVSEIRSDLTYIRDQYGSHPSFWRVGGRFVVFVYADGSDGCGMVTRWKQANVGINAYIVLKVFSGYKLCPDQPDFWHQYGPDTYSDQQGQLSFTVSPGFWQKGKPEILPRDLNRWKSDIRNMVASGAQLQLITTFNEWGEGTAVESAQEWGSASGYGQYLDALHNNGAP